MNLLKKYISMNYPCHIVWSEKIENHLLKLQRYDAKTFFGTSENLVNK